MLDNKEFENAAWDNMLELLDKEIPEKKVFPWFRISLILLFLLFTGAGLAYFIFPDSEAELSQVELVKENSTSPNANDIVESSMIMDVEEAFKESSDQASNNSSFKSNLVGQAKNNKANQQHSVNQTRSLNSIIEDNNGKESNHSESSIQKESSLIPNNNQSSDATKSIPLYSSVIKSKVKNEEEAIDNLRSVTSLELNTELLETQNNLSLLDQNNSPFTALAIDASDMILSELSATRKFDVYAFSEAYYLNDFKSSGLKLGIIAELGGSNSPWSVSTGLLYEHNSLKNIALSSSDKILLEDTISNGVGTSPVGELDVSDASYLTSITYFTAPIQFHYRFNKIKIGLGIENRFLVKHRLINGTRNFVDYNKEERFTNSVQGSINSYHVSANQSIVYRIHPKVDLGLSFQYDVTGIFSSNSFTASNRSVSNRLDHVGIRMAYLLN